MDKRVVLTETQYPLRGLLFLVCVRSNPAWQARDIRMYPQINALWARGRKYELRYQHVLRPVKDTVAVITAPECDDQICLGDAHKNLATVSGSEVGLDGSTMPFVFIHPPLPRIIHGHAIGLIRWSTCLPILRKQYAGLSRYRH